MDSPLFHLLLAPTDGAGLFCGTLNYLLNLGIGCPKVFAVTHFEEIFTQDFLSPTLPISFVHMEILLTGPQGQIMEVEEASSKYMNIERMEINYLYR